MHRGRIASVFLATLGLWAMSAFSPGIEPGFYSWRVRANQTPYDGYRVAVIHESKTSKPRIIAIQKSDNHAGSTTIVPSFCTIEDIDGNPLMHVDGRAVLPQADLVAYFADSGATPQRVILDRADYEQVAQGGILPARSDDDLWRLCTAHQKPGG